ncbi:MAG: AI-2E family transporter [Myxococcota bacterium]
MGAVETRPTLGRRMLGLGLVAAATALLALAPDAVFLSFGGLVFACGLAVPSRWVAERTGLSMGWGVAIVCVGLGAAFGALAAFVGSEALAQLQGLTAEIPRIGRDLQAAFERLGLGPVEGLPTGQIAAQAPEQASKLVSGVVATLGGLLVLAFLAVYLAAQPALYREATIHLVPPEGRERARRVLEEVGHVLAWWLLGRFVGMVVVGALVTAAMALLGSPMPLALGIVAGVLDFVPNVGPILAALPAVLLAAPEGAEQLLAVLGVYLAVQLLEAYVVTPLIERRTAFVPPVLVIVAQLVFGFLFGALGLAFATPAVAAGLVVVRQLWLEDALGEAPRSREE